MPFSGPAQILYQKVHCTRKGKVKKFYLFLFAPLRGCGILLSAMKNLVIIAAIIAALPAAILAGIDFSAADALRKERDWKMQGAKSKPTFDKRETIENYRAELAGVIQAAAADYALYFYTLTLTNDAPKLVSEANKHLERYSIATNLIISATPGPDYTRVMRHFNGRYHADNEDYKETMLKHHDSPTDKEADKVELELRRRKRWAAPLTQF